MCWNYCLATFRWSGLSLCGCALTGGPLVWMWWVTSCVTLSLLKTGRVILGKPFKRSVYGSIASFNMTGLIVIFLLIFPCTISPVLLSINLPHLTSTSMPKWCKKSAPKIGMGSFAIVKIHWKVRRNPRSNVNDFSQKVGIEEWFTACRQKVDGVRFSFNSSLGIMLTSAPVSTRNRVPVFFSVT